MKVLISGTGKARLETAVTTSPRGVVEDIRGEVAEPYPTFREGSQYQLVIDLVRQNNDWKDVSGLN